MAVRVINEVLSKSENTDVRTLCKVLPMLDVSAENSMLVKDLSILCGRLQEVWCLLVSTSEFCANS